jgi:hypothetical protein
MNKFKPGDKVMLINVDRYTYYVDDIPKKLLGKPLVINSIGTDKSGNEIVYAGVPEGVCCWQWHSNDLRLVSSGEPTPFQIACEQCNPGDKIIILSADPTYPPYKREMVGTVQTVIAISAQTQWPIHAEIPGQGITWAWMPDEVRLATPEEIELAKNPQQLRRGDLVVYKGEICVVFSEGPNRVGDYMVASLTGDADYNWPKIDELVRVGSIIKKARRLKDNM